MVVAVLVGSLVVLAGVSMYMAGLADRRAKQRWEADDVATNFKAVADRLRRELERVERDLRDTRTALGKAAAEIERAAKRANEAEAAFDAERNRSRMLGELVTDARTELEEAKRKLGAIRIVLDGTAGGG